MNPVSAVIVIATGTAAVAVVTATGTAAVAVVVIIAVAITVTLGITAFAGGGIGFMCFMAWVLNRDFPPGLLQSWFTLPWPPRPSARRRRKLPYYRAWRGKP